MDELQNMIQEDQGEAPKKKMRLWQKIGWVVVIVIVVVLGVQVALADKYKATVLPIEGEKKVGVNPTTEVLDFGDLSRDTSATRTVSLKSGSGGDTYVYVLKFGSVSELMKVSEQNFTLKGGEEKKVEFSVYMPGSAKIGTRMNGYVWIFKVPKFW
jgi:hypothetical protein